MSSLKFALFRSALRALKRDWYSGELRLIGVSILIAVACLTSVSFFTDRVRRASEQQATELLAADLVLISSARIKKSYVELAKTSNLSYSFNESFRSVVVKNDKLELAEVKAVDSNYPIRGHLKTSNALFDKEEINTAIPQQGTVWLDSRLMQVLQITPGDSITLGASELVVDKILTYEPDRGGDLFNIAPRLLMNRADLDATGLILPGSRVRYKFLLGGNAESIERYRTEIENDENDNIRIQSIKDARPEIKTALAASW